MSGGLKLDQFDWGNHFVSCGAEVEPEMSSTEVVEITDTCLRGTPMVNYLEALKFAVSAMDDKLRATAVNQRRLVSGALFKAKSSG